MMQKFQNNTGQSLIEILFAVAVFTIGVVTIGYLIFDSFASIRFALEAMQARIAAQEGIEAVRSIVEHDFNAAPQGTYFLTLENNAWTLSSSDTDSGMFHRVITVADVDDETKHVTAAVTWGEGIRSKTFSLETYFTDWKQISGQAASLDVDINNTMLSSSSTLLTGIALRNTGDEDLLLTDISVQWEGVPELESVTIRGSEVFNASSSVPASSGETIDIADYTIGSATGYHLIDAITFSGDVSGTDFLLTFVLQDQSRRYVTVSL